MSYHLRDLSEGALLSAIEENIFGFVTLLGSWPRADVHVTPDLIWSLTDVPYPLFNSICRARFTSDNVDDRIESVIGYGRKKDVPLFWWLGPATRPADLASHLEAHGFICEDVCRGMAADLSAINENVQKPRKLVITEVHDEETLKKWCHTFTVGFEMPGFVQDAFYDLFNSIGLRGDLPLRHYIGFLDGMPVSTSSVLLNAGVAGIYNVTVLPAARRQGVGTAIVLAPLLDVRKMGYRVSILHATGMGQGVYRQIGYREYCEIGQYVWTSEEVSKD